MNYKQMLDALDLLNKQVKLLEQQQTILEKRIVLLERQNTVYEHRYNAVPTVPNPLQPPWTITCNPQDAFK